MDALTVLREVAFAWRDKACDQDFARACSARGLEMDRLAAELLAAAEAELPPPNRGLVRQLNFGPGLELPDESAAARAAGAAAAMKREEAFLSAFLDAHPE